MQPHLKKILRSVTYQGSAVLLLGLAGLTHAQPGAPAPAPTTPTSPTSPTSPQVPPATTGPMTAPRAPATNMGGSAKLDSADSGFLKQAAQNNNAEIEASRTAIGKATNTQVKAFAQQMIDDHGNAGRELSTLAGSKGVELSTDPSVMQKGKLAILSARDGAGFDKHYMDTMVDDHKDTVKMFKKASVEAKDPEVKAFAAKLLPSLEKHLEQAQRLQTSLMGAKK